jgi:hypothetical protein
MKLKQIIFIVIGIIVIGVGYWLVSPFFITNKVNEALPELNSSEEVMSTDSVSTSPMDLFQGSFTGFDKIHNGSGTAKIINIDGKTYLRFESDFEVTNGPDLYVGFGKDGEYIKGSEISRLKGNVGSQNYELPDGFDIEKYNEVWVWCKAFAVPFAKAQLQ